MNVTSIYDISHAVKRERLKKGWTQAELAKQAGVSRDWVINLEKAKPTIEIALVLRTLKVLGVRLSITPAAPLSDIATAHLESLKAKTKSYHDED